MERGEQWGQLSLCSFGGRVKGAWRRVSNGGSLVCIVLGAGEGGMERGEQWGKARLGMEGWHTLHCLGGRVKRARLGREKKESRGQNGEQEDYYTITIRSLLLSIL